MTGRPTVRRLRSRLLLGAMAASVAVTGCSGPASPTTDPSAAPTFNDPDRPVPASDLNVLVVLMDDANDVSCADMGKYFPTSSRLLRDQGRCYENAAAAAPSCAPSRAALMSSQYGHNSGVDGNGNARELDMTTTVQYQLREAGWETYGAGKFLNGVDTWGYESGELDSGFSSSDFWNSHKVLGYKLYDDETGEVVKPDDSVHATTRTGQFVRSFIRQQAGEERPFYAFASFKAPHTDNSQPTREKRMPKPTQANRTKPVPKFDWNPEPDTRDKMGTFQRTIATRAYYERFYAARTRAVYDVDDQVGKTIDMLERLGELDNTAIFLTSDQGYHLGENNWETKGDPYSQTLDVPLLAWYPPAFGQGQVDQRPVSLVDLAPTIYDLTDVTPTHVVDGRSVLGERRNLTYAEVRNPKANPDNQKPGFAPGQVPSFSTVRVGTRYYVEFYDRDDRRFRSEFYRDSDMKRNLLWQGYRGQRPPEKNLRWFRTQVNKARACAGTEAQGSPRPCP